jgi:hypothetical protein
LGKANVFVVVGGRTKGWFLVLGFWFLVFGSWFLARLRFAYSGKFLVFGWVTRVLSMQSEMSCFLFDEFYWQKEEIFYTFMCNKGIL